MENKRWWSESGMLDNEVTQGLSLLVYKHRSEQLKWGRVQDHWRKGTRNLKNIVNWKRKLPRFFQVLF